MYTASKPYLIARQADPVFISVVTSGAGVGDFGSPIAGRTDVFKVGTPEYWLNSKHALGCWLIRGLKWKNETYHVNAQTSFYRNTLNWAIFIGI